VSLAHHGVLFLDEAAEFTRSTLEVLREPLEEGVVRLTRAAGTVEHPAAVMLVLASNPCPCGRWTRESPCGCSEASLQRYHQRLSGPLLDRVDLHIEMERVDPRDLLARPPGESSDEVRKRVLAARERQAQRGQSVPNGRLDAAGMDTVAQPTRSARAALAAAMTRLGLSARSTTRALKVARTLADLEGAPRVDEPHVIEALAFRPVSPADHLL
jgi:magnesium chelatase family protein